MEELEQKKKLRTAVKSKATRFKTYVEAYNPNVETIYELESRLEKFEQLW